MVDLEHCPIFLDEADTYLSANAKEDDKDLRRLLNSGHTPTSAYVIRSVPAGEGRWEPKRFSTWAPFVIAGIGKIHDTTEDRSIGIVQTSASRADERCRASMRGATPALTRMRQTLLPSLPVSRKTTCKSWLEASAPTSPRD